MTTALDVPVGRVAAKLIAKFGKAATLTRIFSVHDAAAGTLVDVEAEMAVTCLVESYKAHLVDGTTVKRTDRRLIFSATAIGFEPTPATSLEDVEDVSDLPWGHPAAWDGQIPAGSTMRDVITVGGETFSVHYVEPVYSGENAAIYTVQGRK